MINTYAVIEDSKVKNIILATTAFAAGKGWVVLNGQTVTETLTHPDTDGDNTYTREVTKGDSYDGENFICTEELQQDTNQEPSLVITEITDGTDLLDFSDGSISITAGTSTTLYVEIHDQDSNIIPITDDFVLPIAGLYGTGAKVKTVSFVSGVAECTINWNSEGVYEVTEQQVNHNFSNPDEHFKFERLEFKVED